MKQKKEIRLEDIARKLNISIVTVSNALSGKKGVSDSLRDTIIRTAEELGYDVSRYRERKERTALNSAFFCRRDILICRILSSGCFINRLSAQRLRGILPFF